ncbi:hypothetical protein Ahy_B09g095138 [Arachis hypogaea]|uniref:DUF4283 domain-containing protein n=1 Tax=Arachis hypogaea TaxID=3818 RepID=A0A444XD15_ARAHY|nr:hypothetical protein Ahy_B09g095138 [Arachis hypogaea]
MKRKHRKDKAILSYKAITILEKKREDLLINDAEFSHIPIWTQLLGLPEQYKIKELGRRVGETLKKVMNVAVFSMKGKEERILKIQVLLHITKPLRRKMRISRNNNKIIDLQLKYERIAQKILQIWRKEERKKRNG